VWLPLVVATGGTVVAGVTITVLAAGGLVVVGAFLWITMVRCLMIGLAAAELPAEVGAAAEVDAPIPQLKETAAAPVTKDAVRAPAVASADFLFIPYLLVVFCHVRSAPLKGIPTHG
jgi:hypothetical protein